MTATRAYVAERHITPGAFKDRLGLALVAGLATSTHPLCLGLREFIAGRAYIDLDRPDIRPSLLLLVALELPAPVDGIDGSGPLTAEDVARIVDTEVADEERRP